MRKYKRIIWLSFLVLLFLSALLGLERDQNQMQVDSLLPFANGNATKDGKIQIRVLIKSQGFSHLPHPKVVLQSDAGLRISSENETKEVKAGEKIEIEPDDAAFSEKTLTVESLEEDSKIRIESLERGCGVPGYYGKLQLYSTAEGIIIVNELDLETYICGVLPSEMPSSYEMEALKCQAVCARTYAFHQMQKLAYPEYDAHVDDSTSFQVYGNSEANERTNQAVEDTKGQILYYGDQVAKTYFYSTSCGNTASIEAWGDSMTKEHAYLQSVELKDENGVDYEKDLAWYRWELEATSEELERAVEWNLGKEIGVLQNIIIKERGDGNIAQKMIVEGSEETVEVETENKIRSLLASEEYQVKKQDGSMSSVEKLLPSAFFSVEKDKNLYYITGGGYGHGIGMSQNAANEMAKDGMDYEEILSVFYEGTDLKGR